MKGADHVVVNTATNAFECRHCGARYTPALPCPIPLYIAMSRTFIREHRACLAPAAHAAFAGALATAPEAGPYCLLPAVPVDPSLPMFLRRQAD